MGYYKEISEQMNEVLQTLELEARYMRERNERLEAENEYLKKQVDVLLKVVANEGSNH